MTIYHIPGEDGRLEVDVSLREPGAPVALFLHSHARFGGGMHHPVINALFIDMWKKHGFSCVRFNFRGVGNSEGQVTEGEGEAIDATTILDWCEDVLPKTQEFVIVGHSFGAWIGLQLATRRPEVTHFITLSPPASIYDFSFLDESFCTARGLIVAAGMDNITGYDYMVALKDLIGDTVDLRTIAGSNHFFDCYVPDVRVVVDDFLRDHFS